MARLPREFLPQPLRHPGKLHLPHRRPIASHVDRVHDRQGTAYAKRKSQKKADQRAGGEIHPRLNPAPARHAARGLTTALDLISGVMERDKAGRKQHRKEAGNHQKIGHGT